MNNQVIPPTPQPLSNFKKHISNKVTSLLFFLLFIFTSITFAQSATCAGSTAAVLTVNAAPITGSVTDATVNDPTATACAGGAITRDGWYQFAATSSTATVSVTSGSRQLVLYAYSGTCGTLTQISCANADTNAGAQTEVMNLTGLTASATYYVRVVNSTNNNMALDAVSVTGPPVNNLCANATSLPCGTTNLAGTTVNTANITHGTGCTMSNYGVWYTFVGDGQQTTITTNPAFDIKLSVSTGTCGSLTNIVCTDSSPEQATFTTVNGTTYYVYVSGWSSGSTTTGTFTISRNCTPAPIPPANNLCTNATSLPCGTTNLAGTTVNTLNIAHGTGCSMSNYGVWYTFVGDGNPTTISTNPAFDIKLSISTGTCGALTNIVCTDTSPETATFTSVSGTTYYVYVAGWSSSGTTTGTFTISRSCVTCVPPTATAATNVTFTTATVNWNAPTAYTPSNGYQYAVTTSATPPGSGTATSATSVNVNSLIANTVYYLHVRSDCNANGFSTWSTISFITGYCASTSSSSLYWISNFTTTLGSTNINRNSTYTTGGYADYSATDIVTQITGQSFNFSTTMSSGTHGINIYVDWNNDFDFNDAGELAFASGASYVASATGTISIPNGTPIGNHRMRVVTNYSSTNPSSCGSNTYTETEDYTINAIAPPACTGTPNGGTAIATPSSASPGSSYTVSASGFTNATGLTFQWQSNTNGGGWINVGASSGTYSNYNAIAPALGTTVLWQLVVTCTSSSQSGTSTNATFSSISIQNIPSTGSNTVTCGTNIVLYDNGGSTGDYTNSSSGYTVLEAGLLSTINISGNYVTESVDYIRIYNGTGTGGTLLATYSGTGTINYTGAPGQTLTIQFTSDSSIVYSGFGLSVSYSGVCFPACTGTPTAGTATTTPSTGWPGSSYSVVATGYTQALNMTYQWQYSSNPGGPWTNAGVATSSYASYIATAPASGLVYWHLVVTCTNSSQTAISSNGLFTTMTVSTVVTGCPNVVSGGLGLNGADPASINCSASSTCVDLEATFLDLGETTSYIVEPIAYNPPFSFNGLANPVSVNIDDRWSSIVNLPFDFCFYGATYDRCLVGSNGVITFDTTSNTPTTGFCDWEFDATNPGNLPISGHSSLIENAIFGVFHDINPALGGEIGWELITLPTGCQALVAAWDDVPMYSCTSSLYSGMMVLYENSNIIEIYIQEKNVCATWNDGNAIVGIQNATGTLATVAPGRNGLDANWTTTNEAWRFVPNGNSIASIIWYEGAGVTGPVLGTATTLNVCPASTTTYTAEITYTLCDGRTLKETDQTIVTINGAKVWNGSVSTNWNTANNWTPTGVPSALDCVVVPDTTNDPIIGGTNFSGLGLNLALNTNASLNITATNTLKITDVINVNATGTIVVQDDASIVQINSVPNTGNIQYRRAANIRRQDYVYWSSPVANFASNAVSPGTSLGFQYKWTPTIATNTGEFGNWTFANETMVLGKGYCLRAPDSYSLSAFANYTANFVGVPNNGSISTPISRGNYNTAGTYSTGVSTTLGTRDDDNWNLVGNPYPSAINAINFLTLNPNIAGFVNIWTHGTLPSSATVDPFYNNYIYNYTPTDYITYNATGTSTPGGFNGFIAGGQGFFISMLHSGATTQNLNFDNTLRRDVPTGNTYDNDQFFKTSNKNNDAIDLERHRIWFDLVTPSGTSARALLGYVENATDENDRLFDAFSNEKLSFNIFSLIEDEKMLIQGRKLPFDVNDKVNIGVSIPQDGLYKIALGSVDGLFLEANQNIYIEDKLLNVIFSLKEAPYSFMSNKGTIKDRFILRFTKSDNITELTNQLTVYDNTILTAESSKLKIKDIVIFDTLGKLILNKKNVNNREYQITNLNRTNSMLIVKVTLEDNTEEVRKIIY